MNTMTLENAKSMLAAKRASIEAAAADAKAKADAEKAAAEALAAENEALCEAVGVQKYFKRKRTGVDSIGDAREYFELIRIGERVGKSLLFTTKGISEKGVIDQNYTLSTLLTLDLASPSDFLAAKADHEARLAAK